MKLEQQVASLELSNKLNELEVPQDGCFFWSQSSNLREKPWHVFMLIGSRECRKGDFSAFTVAELGELLPPGYGSHKVADILYSSEQTEPHVEFSCTSPYKHPPTVADTEADARAKMLIYLLENGLMTV